jgi:transposase
MDIISDRKQVRRLEIMESGRRHRFSDEANLAIVAESLSAPRQVTLTAQRHGITRFQLNSWRKVAREGRHGRAARLSVVGSSGAIASVCGLSQSLSGTL